MKRIFVAPAWLTVLALAACGGDSQFPEATGEGNLRAINAIKTSPAISFLIEEQPISLVNFGEGSSIATYDDLEYTFNFETILTAGEPRSRIASKVHKIVRDTTYTFVVSGPLANPVIDIWERPVPEFAEGATNFEIQVGHLAESFGDVDVYLADPATPPVLGSALGTLSFGDQLPVSSLEAGDYVLTLTAPGDVNNVIFESVSVPIPAGNALMFVAFDSDGRDVAPVSMELFNMVAGASNRVADANFPATYRFFHAAADAGSVDIYIDDPLTAPLVAGQAFGDISADNDVPDGILPLTYTAAGDQGVILVDTAATVRLGARYFVYLLETSDGTTTVVEYVPELKPIETVARLSFLQTSPVENGLDVYTVASGETIDEETPLLPGLPSGIVPIDADFIAGPIDIYVTPNGEKTVLAGPIPLDLTTGDVVQIIIYENVDPNVVDVVVLPLT